MQDSATFHARLRVHGVSVSSRTDRIVQAYFNNNRSIPHVPPACQKLFLPNFKPFLPLSTIVHAVHLFETRFLPEKWGEFHISQIYPKFGQFSALFTSKWPFFRPKSQPRHFAASPQMRPILPQKRGGSAQIALKAISAALLQILAMKTPFSAPKGGMTNVRLIIPRPRPLRNKKGGEQIHAP